MSSGGSVGRGDSRRGLLFGAVLPLVAALIGSAILLAGCGGCEGPCSVHGCPSESVCSLATERCMSPGAVYGPPCPMGPQQCHRGICLGLAEEEGGPVCTGTCELGDPPCPGDFRCLPVSDGAGGTLDVCVPRGQGGIGDPCVGDSDCSSRLCLDYEPESFCSDFCNEDPAVCGEGNFGCITFMDTQDNRWDLCVRGGDSGPGQGCPEGIVDCDLTRTEVCLATSDNSINFCTLSCPEGPADCGTIPGSCCVDLGENGVPEEHYCLLGMFCPCQPQCFGRNCGSDGCGGLCGVCGGGQICESGVCVDCTPTCDGAECGPDGCGSQCGTCEVGLQCVGGVCMGSCTPDCELRECGSDGCGGLCGACTSPKRCHAGLCVDPELLLLDILVLDPALDPQPLWGLGEYRGTPSIGPPLVYGQGPQPGTTQVVLCGETVACNEETTLFEERSYELRLGFQIEGELVRCVATFGFDSTGVVEVDGGDCLPLSGGPFEEVWVEGDLAAPSIGWRLP